MVSFDRAYLCHKILIPIGSYLGFYICRPPVFEPWSLNEEVLAWEGPCIPSVGWGAGTVSLAIARIGGNVDQGAPLRPFRGAGTGARVESEKSRIQTVAPERLQLEDGGAGGTGGQWAVAASSLHLQSRVCQHVRLPGQSPQTGKRGGEKRPWAFGVGVGAGGPEGTRKGRGLGWGKSSPEI